MRTSSKRTLTAFVAVILVASGCNSRLIRPPAIVFVDAGEYAVRTAVNEQRRRFPTVYHAFLPSQIPLHPGDAVNFQVRDTGEPHAIAMGRLVDAAATAAEARGPTATLRQIEALPAMKKIPSVFPWRIEAGATPRLNRSAAERCFLARGDPPVSVTGGAEACEETEQPEFDGRQDFYSGGVLEEGEPFRVRLADDIRPATYRFMCLVHRSAMTGSIEVRSKDVERPPVAELRANADREQEEIASALEPPAREAASARGDRPIFAGTGPAGITRAFVAAFIPNERRVRVNDPVRWKLYRSHSITFRPEREAKEGLLIAEGDTTRVNADAWRPVRSRPLHPRVFEYPPTQQDFRVGGGTWNGEGTWSSGVIRSTPLSSVTYGVRFSKAGEYDYFCLIHPAMRGKIIVER